MVNKLASAAMKKKYAVSPAPPKEPMVQARGADKTRMDDDMRYRAREAMNDIARAEMHKRDPKLMKAVKEHVDSINQALGGGERAGGMKKKR